MKKTLITLNLLFLSSFGMESDLDIKQLAKQLVSKTAPFQVQSIRAVLDSELIPEEQEKGFKEEVHLELRKVLDNQSAKKLNNLNKPTHELNKNRPLCTAILLRLRNEDESYDHHIGLLSELGAKPCNLLLARLLNSRALDLDEKKDVSCYETYLEQFLDAQTATEVLRYFYEKREALHPLALQFLLQKEANPNVEITFIDADGDKSTYLPLELEKRNSPNKQLLLQDGAQFPCDYVFECNPAYCVCLPFCLPVRLFDYVNTKWTGKKKGFELIEGPAPMEMEEL